MMELIGGLLSFGFNVISFIFTLIIAMTIGMVMTAKGRNGFLWGVAGLFFPILILVVWFIPARVPRLHPTIRRHPDFAGLNPVVASIMALSAMVAKSDGHVSVEEIRLVRNFVQRQYGLSGQEMNRYEGAFNYGKDNPDTYEYFTDLLRQYRRFNTVMAVAYLLVGMGLRDGDMATEEDSILRRIITGLGLHEYEYQSIIRHYRGASQGSAYGSYQRAYEGAYGSQSMAREDLTKKYSDVLGVDVDADMSTIKKAYRKLAKENHPDKMSQEGMPEDYVAYANKRISEINEAYDYLKNLKAATA